MGAPTIPLIPDRTAGAALPDAREPGRPRPVDPGQPRDPLAALAAYLDPPEPGAYVEVDLAAAAAIVAKLGAARAVVAAAQAVGHPGLDETDLAERLADALDAYDHATKVRWSR